MAASLLAMGLRKIFYNSKNNPKEKLLTIVGKSGSKWIKVGIISYFYANYLNLYDNFCRRSYL